MFANFVHAWNEIIASLPYFMLYLFIAFWLIGHFLHGAANAIERLGNYTLANRIDELNDRYFLKLDDLVEDWAEKIVLNIATRPQRKFIYSICAVLGLVIGMSMGWSWAIGFYVLVLFQISRAFKREHLLRDVFHVGEHAATVPLP